MENLKSFYKEYKLELIIIAVIALIIIVRVYMKRKSLAATSSPKKESSFNKTLRAEEQSEVETAVAPRPTGNDVYDTMVMRG